MRWEEILDEPRVDELSIPHRNEVIEAGDSQPQEDCLHEYEVRRANSRQKEHRQLIFRRILKDGVLIDLRCYEHRCVQRLLSQRLKEEGSECCECEEQFRCEDLPRETQQSL